MQVGGGARRRGARSSAGGGGGPGTSARSCPLAPRHTPAAPRPSPAPLAPSPLTRSGLTPSRSRRPGRRSRLRGQSLWPDGQSRCPPRAERGGRGDGSASGASARPFRGGGGRGGGEVTLFQRNQESPRDAPPRPPLHPQPRRAAPTAVWALPLRGALGPQRGQGGQSPALGKGGTPFKIKASTLVIRTVQEIKQGLGTLWLGAPQN